MFICAKRSVAIFEGLWLIALHWIQQAEWCLLVVAMLSPWLVLFNPYVHDCTVCCILDCFTFRTTSNPGCQPESICCSWNSLHYNEFKHSWWYWKSSTYNFSYVMICMSSFFGWDYSCKCAVSLDRIYINSCWMLLCGHISSWN